MACDRRRQPQRRHGRSATAGSRNVPGAIQHVAWRADNAAPASSLPRPPPCLPAGGRRARSRRRNRPSRDARGVIHHGSGTDPAASATDDSRGDAAVSTDATPAPRRRSDWGKVQVKRPAEATAPAPTPPTPSSPERSEARVAADAPVGTAERSPRARTTTRTAPKPAPDRAPVDGDVQPTSVPSATNGEAGTSGAPRRRRRGGRGRGRGGGGSTVATGDQRPSSDGETASVEAATCLPPSARRRLRIDSSDRRGRSPHRQSRRTIPNNRTDRASPAAPRR